MAQNAQQRKFFVTIFIALFHEVFHEEARKKVAQNSSFVPVTVSVSKMHA